jgi:hypothetical protein
MPRLFVFQTVFRREKHETKDKKQNKVKKKKKGFVSPLLWNLVANWQYPSHLTI